MFTLIGIFRIKVNFLTCIFASTLVGLTGDNAIQFLLSSGNESLLSGMSQRGKASIVCGSIMAVSSLVFLGSYFVPPRIFGALLSAGFLMSMVGDFWLLKALLPREEALP
jgi:hypothetical protein